MFDSDTIESDEDVFIGRGTEEVDWDLVGSQDYSNE